MQLYATIGEGNTPSQKVNTLKTDEQVKTEWFKTLALPGAMKKVVNRTPEGALVLLCDPISYVAKDFSDGIIKGFINIDSKLHEDIFIKMGLSKKTLDEWSANPNINKRTQIIEWVTQRLRDDLIENSRNYNGVKMSKKMADLMYKLRDLNYDTIIRIGIRDINKLVMENIGTLVNRYSDILLNPNKSEFNASPKATYYRSKMLSSINGQPENIVNMYTQTVSSGIENRLISEIETVISDIINPNEDKNPKSKYVPTIRRPRIELDLKLARKNNIDITTEDFKKKYFDRLIKEIYLSPEESNNLFRKRIISEFNPKSEEELKYIMEKNKHLRLETFDECMAKLRTTIYLGESTNSFLLNIFVSEGILSEEDVKKYRYSSTGISGTPSLDKNIEDNKIEDDMMI